MPKKPVISSDRLADLAEQASHMAGELSELADDVNAGRVAGLGKPTDLARRFASLAAEAARLSSSILASDGRQTLDARLAVAEAKLARAETAN